MMPLFFEQITHQLFSAYFAVIRLLSWQQLSATSRHALRPCSPSQGTRDAGSAELPRTRSPQRPAALARPLTRHAPAGHPHAFSTSGCSRRHPRKRVTARAALPAELSGSDTRGAVPRAAPQTHEPRCQLPACVLAAPAAANVSQLRHPPRKRASPGAPLIHRCCFQSSAQRLASQV